MQKEQLKNKQQVNPNVLTSLSAFSLQDKVLVAERGCRGGLCEKTPGDAPCVRQSQF